MTCNQDQVTYYTTITKAVADATNTANLGVWTQKVPKHYNRCSCSSGLHRILVPTLANPKSGHFFQIWPTPALAKFLAGFGRRHNSCSAFS